MTSVSTGAALAFLNEHEARTVDAMVSRIIPGDNGDPGAREAGAATYIDGALAGFYRDLQTVYRRGLEAVDRRSRERHGVAFADLEEGKQDALLAELDVALDAPSDRRPGSAGEGDEVPAAANDQPLLVEFFAIVRQHTIEGTFGDPLYGGNRDGLGWRLVGFPGALWGYSEEQMKPGFDARQIPLATLADLRRQRGSAARAEEERID